MIRFNFFRIPGRNRKVPQPASNKILRLRPAQAHIQAGRDQLSDLHHKRVFNAADHAAYRDSVHDLARFV